LIPAPVGKLGAALLGRVTLRCEWRDGQPVQAAGAGWRLNWCSR